MKKSILLFGFFLFLSLNINAQENELAPFLAKTISGANLRVEPDENSEKKITAVFLGKYSSIKEAVAAGAKNIRNQVVGNKKDITEEEYNQRIDRIREIIKGDVSGITGYLVDMLNEGCFRALMDVQCFDLKAAASIRDNPNHCEVGAAQYASAGAKSSIMDSLDVAVLGATEIDTDFNVNVHTDSSGRIMGGSGGHSDAAAGSKLSIITAPLFRGRLPIVRDRVTCISTPGKDIDVLVTQAGIAVNPRREELRERLTQAGMQVLEITQLRALAEQITGTPAPLPPAGRVIAKVIGRDGTLLDTIGERKGEE